MSPPMSKPRQAIHLAKALVYGVQHYADKKQRERQIRRFDRAVPLRPSGGVPALSSHGWALSTSQALFGCSLADLLNPDAVDLPPVNEMGNTISRRIGPVAMERVLASARLTDLVKAYLGEDARLDDLYLWKKDYAVQRRFDISESWHTDNVGHRLKMFVSVEASEGAPSTLIVDGSHRHAYQVGLGEISRFFGRIGSPGVHASTAEIQYQRDVVSVFDTNALHRGSYASTRAHRTCLVLEFIDRRKGDLLSGACPCGPGQSPTGRVEFSPALAGLLRGHPLIDPALLREEADCISYSIANKSSTIR